MSIKNEFLNKINNYEITEIADFYLNDRSLEEAILIYFKDKYRSDSITVTFSYNSSEFYHEFSTMDDPSLLLAFLFDKFKFDEDLEFFLEDGTQINLSDQKYIGSFPFLSNRVKLIVNKRN